MADKEKKAGADNVFAVEKLIRHKKEKGKTFYLVKWKGWSARHNTWEPEENILDLALLQDYREREEKKTQRKTEKAEKTAAKRGSSGSSKKATPEQPREKRKRRLAGGEIREESSESSEHDEAEAPSTSGTAAPVESQEEEQPLAEAEEPEQVEELLSESPELNEGEDHDDVQQDSPVVEEAEYADSNGDRILTDEEQDDLAFFESGAVDFEGNDEEDHTMDETLTMPDDEYIVGRAPDTNGLGDAGSSLHNGLDGDGNEPNEPAPSAAAEEVRPEREGDGGRDEEGRGDQA